MPINIYRQGRSLTYGDENMLRIILLSLFILLSSGCAGYKVNNIHISYTPDSKQYIETTISLDY